MATIHPFHALRPSPADAARIAAVPYDVVSAEEARALAAGNPLSFLHVSRAEIDLPPATDPYAGQVYAQAAKAFDSLKSALVVEDRPSLYFYRLRMGSHEQTGLAGCYSIDEYEGGLIKKHERTRRDKEDDRTRHIVALRAQTGPVFLTYRASAEVDAAAKRAAATEPLFDFEAADLVRHTIWRVAGGEVGDLVTAFARIPALYIADGHHRAASAARARTELKVAPKSLDPRWSLPGGADHATFLGVAFPHDHVQILPYNRTVKDLAGLTPEAFLAEVRTRFAVREGPAAPARRGEVGMYLGGRWQTLTLGGVQVGARDPRGSTGSPQASGGGASRAPSHDVIGTLDVSILQEQLLAPLLKIADVRTDKRIDFVGGIRGTSELERLVNGGKAAVAFSLYPVSVGDLMAIADAGEIMPPKSTWFEPKLRDGLLIHMT